MKNIVALVLSEIAAAMIGLACWEAYGDPWAAVSAPLAILATFTWLWAVGRDRAEAVVKFHEGVEKILSEPSEEDAFRRDVVAVAYGEMGEEEFDRKWAGRVPPSPRPPRRKERFVELFKEIMADPQYASEGQDLRDKIAAEIRNELERPSDGKATWTCKVTLGIHEDGPCRCIELASSPCPLYRKGQYVRMRGEIWIVERSVLCHGPKDMKWWAYYVEREVDRRHPDEKDLALALPQPGEWWEYRKCSKPLVTGSLNAIHSERDSTPQKWVGGFVSDVQHELALCGCLAPVNYGRGWASFDPSKAQRVPSTGITYIMGTPKKPGA